MSGLMVCDSCWALWEEPREIKTKGSGGPCCVCGGMKPCAGPISKEARVWLHTKYCARRPNLSRFIEELRRSPGSILDAEVTVPIVVELLDELERRYMERIAALEDRVAQLEPPPPHTGNISEQARLDERQLYIGDGTPNVKRHEPEAAEPEPEA